MTWIDDHKGAGPWPLTEQQDKWGYLNNKRWTDQPETVEFCNDLNLPIDLSGPHTPCGHWHKERPGRIVRTSYSAGRWVAALSQPDTSYIYLYDIGTQHVIKLDTTSDGLVILSEVLDLNSAYNLDYNQGYGNPGAQRGGYCMSGDATRLWYLFRNASGDCQLIEVDISQKTMVIIRKTLFTGLLAGEDIQDSCADNNYTYWCTNRLSGRIIKIQNSDHSVVDDHLFNFSLPAGAEYRLGIITISIHNERLYWTYVINHAHASPSYNACAHYIKSDLEFNIEIDEEDCGSGLSTPGWQNMLRIYDNYIIQHHAYHPSNGYVRKKSLTDYSIIGSSGQDYMQNILGVLGGNLFTLMHENTVSQHAYLYCRHFSDMSANSTLQVTYYTGQGPSGVYDWIRTSVSALNVQSEVIIIVRYHDVTGINNVACFKADSDLDLLSDTPLSFIETTLEGNISTISDEPQVWSMPD